jgi:hypothetical protein
MYVCACVRMCVRVCVRVSFCVCTCARQTCSDNVPHSFALCICYTIFASLPLLFVSAALWILLTYVLLPIIRQHTRTRTYTRHTHTHTYTRTHTQTHTQNKEMFAVCCLRRNNSESTDALLGRPVHHCVRGVDKAAGVQKESQMALYRNE